YQNGEYTQVWAELVALDSWIRDPDLIADAHAVARETMRRVAVNIDLLFRRLQAMDYEFRWPDAARCLPAPDINARLAEVEARIGVLPLALHAWYEIVGSVAFQGVFPPALMQMMFDELGPDNLLIGPPDDFYLYSDALEIFSLNDLEKSWRPAKPDADTSETDTWWGDQAHAKIAQDFVHKAGFSGGEFCGMQIPNLAIDGPILGLPWCYSTPSPWKDGMWFIIDPAPPVQFVEYLRICCYWGGFPGFAAAYATPPPFLRDLTQDLMPF
ncbi:MAG TPA: hypothetical protein VFM49_03350, partial [Chloroflexia bacterium]|nr:hypothetical protein [Chloroflexia bacterium]